MINNPFRRTIFVCCTLICLALGHHADAADPIAYLVADSAGDPYGVQPGIGQIDAFDASGGYLGAVVTGLTVPSALTIGPNGYLYVANHNTGPNNGQVLAYDPNNNFAPVNSGGIVNGVFASGLNGPGGLLASGNTLYVSELGDIVSDTPFQGNLIKHYDSLGNLITQTNNPLSAGEGQTGLAGMAIDSAGSLYVAAFIGGGSGDVLKFDHIPASTAYATPPSVFVSVAPGASGILFHGGDLYVADQLAGTVAGYDSTGALLPSSVSSGLLFPAGLFDRGDGNMLIAEINAGAPVSGAIDLYNFSTAATTPFITAAGEGALFQPLAVIAVPEPSAIMLSLIGLPLLIRSIKARRRRTTI